MAAIQNGDWEGSIRAKLARSERNGVTHSLFVQSEGTGFVYAARVPLAAVLPIWAQQRDISQSLIDRGVLGRQKKNHAANGRSPTIWRSMVKRDRRVRAEVLKRAEGVCEREGCQHTREWAGFLDVHHILGADKSDRAWNCVALCPNCHREAHYSPEHGAINADLLAYASAFRQSGAA